MQLVMNGSAVRNPPVGFRQPAVRTPASASERAVGDNAECLVTRLMRASGKAVAATINAAMRALV
jgi:hypothetical protein